MTTYGGLLDACVLVPMVLADTLLRVAERGLYRPLWSAAVLDETRAAVVRVHPGIDRDLVERRLRMMNEAFEDALVTGWEPLLVGVTLPDPDDRHVVAAAVCGGAQTIVTTNLTDFPEDVLSSLDLVATHPDDFLLDQLDLAPPIVLDVIREQAACMKRPPLSVPDVVARLARAGVPSFADEIARHL